MIKLETPTNSIICEDVLSSKGLPSLPDESVSLAVTSPPYWQIKDYNNDDQIGFGQTYEDYLGNMTEVFSQMQRVLKPGCRMAINIGDQYLRASEHGRYRVQPIPSHFTSRCVDLGLDYMGGIIWRKISTTNTTGGCSLMGSMYFPRDGHITYEHEFILLFKKQGKSKPVKDEEVKAKSELTKEERSKWFRGVWDDVRPETKSKHPAPFPVELPRRLIKMYSFWGELVLDPFMGSGTTAMAAQETGRNFVGFEISQEYWQMAQERIGL